MNKKSVILVGLLFIFALLVLIFSTLFGGIEKEKEKDAVIVKNYSDFFTVNSCLYRVVTYLNNEDKDTMLLLVSDSFKKKNKVTKENVLDYFDKVLEPSTFTSKKMLYTKINENITKYYVYGTIDKDDTLYNDKTSKPESKDAYFIVYLDSKNNTFTIEPYSGKIFEGGK